MNMINAAIFDFDGTLADSMGYWQTAGVRLLQSMGLEPEPGLKDVFRPLTLRQCSEYIVDRYPVGIPVEEVMKGINRNMEEYYFRALDPKPGAIDLLEGLRERGVVMSLATNTAPYLIDAMLDRCDMRRFFEHIFPVASMGHGKDEPVFFDICAERMGADKKKTAVVEDALHAITTARTAGFITVAVRDTYETHQDEMRRIGDFYLPDYLDLDEFWTFVGSGVG